MIMIERQKLVQNMEKREQHHVKVPVVLAAAASLSHSVQAAKQRNSFPNSLLDCQEEVQLVGRLKELFS